MSNKPGKAIGLEGLSELQRALPKDRIKAQGSKKVAVPTTRSLVEDQKNSDAEEPAWKKGDNEMIDAQDPLPKYSHLRTGYTAPASLTSFVKLQNFEKFCCWVDDKHHEVKKWLDKDRLYSRHWDLFYIYAPMDIEAAAILLLPLPQVEHFLRTINKHLNTNMTMPAAKDSATLVHEFPDNGTPRPRYIASSSNPEDLTFVKPACPHRSYIPELELTNHEDCKTPTKEDVLDFRAKMAAMSKDNRALKEKDALKKMETRRQHQNAKGQEILRAQRYLGLRKKNDLAAKEKLIEVEKEKEAGTEFESEYEDEFDVDQPKTPYLQESSVVFVCIDIEAFEFSPNQITEIGVATLDTKDIEGVAPGKNGCNWWNMIRAQHYIVKEYRHLENKVHCQGNRDGFVFGRSELVWSRNVRNKIISCFKPPFSKPNAPYSKSFVSPDRNIVFVGHDAKQDLQYLKRLNVDLSQLKSIIDILDSSNMYQSLRRELNGSSLHKTLLHLGMVGLNLHNGGNDAVYTMRAMIGIAIKAKVDNDELEEEHEIELKKRIEAEMDRASKVIRMQKEGWNLDSDDDGGEPGNPFARFEPKKSTQKPTKSRFTDSAKGAWSADLAKKAQKAKDTNEFSPLSTRFGLKKSNQKPPKLKVMNSAKGAWSANLAKKGPKERDANNFPPLSTRSTQHE